MFREQIRRKVHLVALPCLLSIELSPTETCGTANESVTAAEVQLSEFLAGQFETSYTAFVTLKKGYALPMLGYHCARLLRGAKKLNPDIQVPEQATLQQVLLEVVAEVIKAGKNTGELQLVINLVREGDSFHCNVHISSVNDPFSMVSPVQAECRGDPRNEPQVKNTSWYSQRKSLESQRKAGVSETILIGTDDEGFRVLLEGLVTNIFIVTRSLQVWTAPDHLVLPGSMRACVLLACEQMGLSTVQKQFRLCDITTCEIAFLTNARKPLVPVQAIYVPTSSDENPDLERVLLPCGSEAIALVNELRNTVHSYMVKTAFRTSAT